MRGQENVMSEVELESFSNVVGNVIENCPTRTPWNLFQKGDFYD